MFNIGDIMRKVQEMQGQMSKVQESLSAERIEGSSGGGLVRVVCTGRQELVSLEIDPSVIDPNDKEMLQDLIMAATNDAMRRSRELAEKEMGKLTGGLKIPGIFPS